jgi:carbon-monoxide dehydrogenase medium subunit
MAVAFLSRGALATQQAKAVVDATRPGRRAEATGWRFGAEQLQGTACRRSISSKDTWRKHFSYRGLSLAAGVWCRHARTWGPAAVRPFGFQAPTSVEETLRLLGEHGSEATLLAGGQSLMILLRQGLVVPELLIGLKRVEELRTVEPRGGGLRLGSMVTYRTAAADPRIAGSLPPLGAAARSVGSVHIRNLGTIGGSLCHADPAGDVPTVLLALDATLHTASPGGAAASHAVDGFFRGLFQTSLDTGELLVAVDLPAQPPGASFGYRRFSFRHGEYPMAVAACRLGFQDGRCTGARVAVGGGGAYPVRLKALEDLLEGTNAGDALAAAATEAPFESLQPIADVRGGEAWKRRVVTNLVRQTVADAVGKGG